MSESDESNSEEQPSELTEGRKYRQEDLIKMRRNGLSKPPNVPWTTWNAPFKMNDRHEAICYGLAQGIKKKQIAEMFEMSYEHLMNICKMEDVQFRVKELRWEMYGSDPKAKFEAMIPSAMRVVNDILNNASTKDQTRLNAAKEIFDRAMGKSIQTFETVDTSLADLYKEIGKITEAEINKAIDSNNSKTLEDIEEVDFQPVEKGDKLETEQKSEPDSGLNDALETFYGKEKESKPKEG